MSKSGSSLRGYKFTLTPFEVVKYFFSLSANKNTASN